MNKSDLISAMADSAGISKAQAGEALNAFMDSTSSALKKGEKINPCWFRYFLSKQ